MHHSIIDTHGRFAHLCSVVLYNSPLFEIRLVTHKQLVNAFRSVTVNLCQPAFDVLV